MVRLPQGGSESYKTTQYLLSVLGIVSTWRPGKSTFHGASRDPHGSRDPARGKGSVMTHVVFSGPFFVGAQSLLHSILVGSRVERDGPACAGEDTCPLTKDTLSRIMHAWHSPLWEGKNLYEARPVRTSYERMRVYQHPCSLQDPKRSRGGASALSRENIAHSLSGCE